MAATVGFIFSVLFLQENSKTVIKKKHNLFIY
jgi:hypothetical protein